MTAGHTHRQWPVKLKRGGIIHRVLTAPIYQTKDLAKVDPSPYPYGIILHGKILEKTPVEVHPDEFYYLSTLSILHRWTGLVIKVGEK